MDRHDVLGPRPDRHGAFSRELLAETDDGVLTEIVTRAAAELDTPIALVTLVLEHIQYFKAQVGLPPDLAASRATDRDVSFCQFVVRDDAPFEVEDAEVDPRVPRQLVEQYAIRSYLGVPLHVERTVVGSLCVIDTEPRVFSDDDRRALARLAELVDRRLAELVREIAPIAERAAAPALSELARMLAPLQGSAAAGLMSASAVASFLRLARHVREGGETPDAMMDAALATAEQALEEAEDAFFNLQANLADLDDTVRALRDVLDVSRRPRLSELAEAGRELARSQTESVGGAILAALEGDPTVATPRALGVALVATCLSGMAARMTAASPEGAIQMVARDDGKTAEIAILGPIDERAAAELRLELERAAAREASVSLASEEGAVRLGFAVTRSG